MMFRSFFTLVVATQVVRIRCIWNHVQRSLWSEVTRLFFQMSSNCPDCGLTPRSALILRYQSRCGLKDGSRLKFGLDS